MGKLTRSLGAKITAVILDCVFIAAFVAGAMVTISMAYDGVYTESEDNLRLDAIANAADDTAAGIMFDYYETCYATESESNGDGSKNTTESGSTSYYSSSRNTYSYYVSDNGDGGMEYGFFWNPVTDLAIYAEQYSRENSNLFFSIADMQGNVLLENYHEDDYCYNGQFTASRSESSSPEDIVMSYYVCNDITANDGIFKAVERIDTLLRYRYIVPVAATLSFIAAAVLFVFLICAAGHRKDTDEIVLNWLDKIPLDLYGGAILCVGLICWSSSPGFMMLCLMTCCLMVPLCLSFVLTFASRAKKGAWWHNTVVFMICRLLKLILIKIGHGFAYLGRNISLIWKALLIYGGVSLLELIVLVIIGSVSYYNTTAVQLILLFWFIEKCAVTPVLCLVAVNLQKLRRAGEKIAQGDTEYAVDTSHMFRDFKRHGENLNSMNTAVQKAVDQQLKSERFRTELITNVSHDIKTPITSIVNYVDLLKKENVSEPTAREYIEVLDRQSARLKKLTEDLVEASKVSSGAITANLRPTDLKLFVEQASGEYSSRFDRQGLEAVTVLPDEPVFAMADGRLLWRVLDNIMSNVCKYSMENTRVYIQLTREKGQALIEVKNISRQRLNIDASELMERFVRGDMSRNTEGSGLGLNISAGLAELQKGSFNIEIDGDLFKAKVRLPLAPDKSENTAETEQTPETGNFGGAFKPLKS